VAFASAVYEGTATVEGIVARRLPLARGEIEAAWDRGEVPVLVDPEGLAVKARSVRPDVVVDAILAKRNTGTRITDAPAVIALGPGFTAGADCHAVIETERGHYLGRVIWEGQARPDTGVPGRVGGQSTRRVLRAPAGGTFQGMCCIGDLVGEGETVATAAGVPVVTPFDGVLRGLLHDGVPVRAGMKVGDVDPRGVPDYCFTISDKARAIGGAVLEAILILLPI
jgi:xanthine dehydrogenase accessory factor